MSNLIYYSVNTKLANFINEEYYNNIHYVWVAPYFNCNNNPSSANPYIIYKNLITDLRTNAIDYHSINIENNKIGLQKGAFAKEKEGVITSKERELIIEMVKQSNPHSFMPVIYVIPSKDVSHLITKPDFSFKANLFSREYIISNLDGKDV